MNNDERGFTLIELISVVVILAILSLISVNVVDQALKRAKEVTKRQANSSLVLSAKNWLNDHKEVLNYPMNNVTQNNQKYIKVYVTFGELIRNGYADINTTYGDNDHYVDESTLFDIYKDNGEYKAELDGDVVLRKDRKEEVSTYIVPYYNNSISGCRINLSDYATATQTMSFATSANPTKSAVTPVETLVYSEGNSKILKQEYTVNGAKFYATLVKSDFLAPTISLPATPLSINLTANGNNITSSLLLSGVTATDNIDSSSSLLSKITIDTTSITHPGIYTINYSVEDSVGNIGRASRMVTVTGVNLPYSELLLNGADPVLSNGMIPVNISTSGTVTKADISNEWYNYGNKKWANMVIVNSSSRSKYQSATAGTTITQSDILGYFVWVPRYRYQLFNATGADGTSSRIIQLIFESKYTPKSTGTSNGDWLTAPGFTFGGDELNGLWVGKFEPTGTTTTPTVLPKVTALAHLSVSSCFNTSQKFNNMTTYGINNDSHMAKNSEWGAVAYLSQSKYGRCSSGICTEISINNSSTMITGSSGGSPSAASSATVYAYNTTQGYLASTTGNITGIYDMSGGAMEYVMGDFVDGSGNKYSGHSESYNSGYNGLYGQGGKLTTGLSYPANKYYELYTANQNVLGEALLETRGWNKDKEYYIEPSFPWIGRGGAYDEGESGGIWSYNNFRGYPYTASSFRDILAP